MKTERKLRWGLIGCGDISRRRVAPALRDSQVCELVAVSSANFEQAESFAREFGAKSFYRDWRDLIADPEVEAIYVATPVHLHAAQTVAAAEAGKHVLCEKPMALTATECERMLAASEANGVRLGVAYYRRFYGAVERVRAILSSGEIGMPVIAQLNAFERFEPEPTNPRRWLLDKRLSGGGPMFDFGCHRVEVLLNLFGRVKTVRASVSNVLFRREVEDTACALIEFEGGPHAVLSVTHAAREPQDTLVIFGGEGSIHVDVLNEGKLRIKTGVGERVELHPPHQNFHLPLIEDFARAVFKGVAPGVDGRVGLEVARVVEEIYTDAEAASGGEHAGHIDEAGELQASGG